MQDMLFSKDFINKERALWHKHFTPSLIAALIVAVIMAFMRLTLSNVILFSSVAASAFILTHSRSHHLTRLHTTIVAYIIAMLVSGAVYLISLIAGIPLSVHVFIAIFLTAILLYLANAIHPPAVSASLSFVMVETYISGLVWLFFAILILFIMVRLATYVFSQHLSLKNFTYEFTRSFQRSKKKI